MLMKLLVMSDSHYRKNTMSDIIAEHRDADAFIFLGDGIGDFEDALAENGLEYSDMSKEIIAVLGNCDSFLRSGGHLVRTIGGINFYITHGAAENVKMGYWSLIEEAKRFDCPVALFGHTHVQCCIDKNGVKLFNPGAVVRGEYGIIEIKNGELKFSERKI